MCQLISPETRFLELPVGLALECGRRLAPVTVGYRTWGRLAADGGNAVLVCHALTGSADVDRWWPGLLGPGRALDPRRDFVVATNVLGSCYGTTGPTTVDPAAGVPWGADFPPITVRDMVRLQELLLDALGVGRLALVVGGSLGGMQALEWVVARPQRVARATVIAAPPRHSPWSVALGEAQRAAIRADGRWRGGRYSASDPPAAGLAAARMMAMCSYRSPVGLEQRFGGDDGDAGRARCIGFLRHHGDALVRRFDANSYLTLTAAMDSHDVGRGRGGLAAALGGVTSPVLVVGITSDVLYPPAEPGSLAAAMPTATLRWLDSPHGHDAFLIEIDALDTLLRDFRTPAAAGAPGRLACAS